MLILTCWVQEYDSVCVNDGVGKSYVVCFTDRVCENRDAMRKPATYVFSPFTLTTVAGGKMAGKIMGLVKGQCTRR